MFLIIFEDGGLTVAETIDDDTFTSADDGYIDIVDITNDEPLKYHQNKWHKIDKVYVGKDNE